jgi:hypothetical protein
MKKWMFLLATLLCAVVAGAQNLKFRSDGTFHIVQFTDVHFNGSQASKRALRGLDSVLVAEKPDLVVLTGDIIWGRPARENLLQVLHRVSAYNVPFVYLFGNHDWEQGLSNRQLYDIARGVKGCINPDLSGQPELDFTLRLAPHSGTGTAAVLYCLDSHAYPKGFPDDKSHGTYAWLTFEQVEWYRAQSRMMARQPDGEPVPALAFFHIPLPEYHQAATDENATLIGNRRESACSPEFNTGMFTAMMEQGDVMGVFVGHDHDNDYCALWHNIVLGYGRYSGGNTVYNHLPAGARVIVLYEGQRRFSTYVREFGGKVCNEAVYPDSFVADDWEKRPQGEW